MRKSFQGGSLRSFFLSSASIKLAPANLAPVEHSTMRVPVHSWYAFRSVKQY